VKGGHSEEKYYTKYQFLFFTKTHTLSRSRKIKIKHDAVTLTHWLALYHPVSLSLSPALADIIGSSFHIHRFFSVNSVFWSTQENKVKLSVM
jgi:hypothetical protein